MKIGQVFQCSATDGAAGFGLPWVRIGARELTTEFRGGRTAHRLLMVPMISTNFVGIGRPEATLALERLMSGFNLPSIRNAYKSKTGEISEAMGCC